MITVNVNKMVKKLKNEFHSPASRFINKNLWNDCLSIFSDQNRTEKIIFANDLGVPPVKAVIKILIDDYNYPPNTVFNVQEARNLGSLINFIFKDLLEYDSVHSRRTVKLCGVKEGCIFTKSYEGISEQLPSTTYQAYNSLDIAECNILHPEEPVDLVNDDKPDFGGW